jgi:hypothetical protein
MVNSYIYGGNNPLKYRDPSGMSFWQTTMGQIVIGVVISAAIVASAGLAAWGAVALLGIQSALTGAAVGALAGAIAGGLVGGGLTVLFKQGTFKEGFIQGAITGAMVGAMVGASQAGVNARNAANRSPSASVTNKTGRNLPGSGNVGSGTGTGDPVPTTLRPGQTVNINNPSPEGITDIDTINGIKYRGTETGPNYNIVPGGQGPVDYEIQLDINNPATLPDELGPGPEWP